MSLTTFDMKTKSSISSSRKITPLEPKEENSFHRIVNIRPYRHVSIHYHNPFPRDTQFECTLFSQSNNSSVNKYDKAVLPRYIGSNSRVANKSQHFQAKTISSEDNNCKGSQNPIPLPDCSDFIKHPNITLFFIHGVGGSANVWKGQVDHFKNKGFHIIVPEWIGHGLCPVSNKQQDYLFDEIKLDLLTVFDYYCNKNNIVVGHSYGCCFAAVLARMRPRLVNNLMLISGGAPTPLAPQRGLFQSPVCILHCLEPILQCCFLRRAFSKKTSPVAPRNIAFDVPPSVMKMTMNGQIWPDGDTNFHNRINCATCIIHGADDQLISIDEEIYMRDTINGSLLYEVEDASHMVMMERPLVINTFIESMISENFGDIHTTTKPTTNTEKLIDEEMDLASLSNDACNVHLSEKQPAQNSIDFQSQTSVKSIVNVNNNPAVLNHASSKQNQYSPRPKSAKAIPDRLFSAKRRKLLTNDVHNSP